MYNFVNDEVSNLVVSDNAEEVLGQIAFLANVETEEAELIAA